MGNSQAGDSADMNWRRRAPYKVMLAATEILKVAGMSGYHTSIIVDDQEYFFDSLGIMAAPPLWSHVAGAGINREVVDCGRTASNGKALVQALGPFFEKGTYDIFHKNCNTFTDVALYYLTKTRLPSHYSRIERIIAATNPVSTGLLNRVFKAFIEKSTGQECEVDVYVQNPESENFVVADVIRSLDESDSESDSDDDNHSTDSDASGHASCNIAGATCCRQEEPDSRPLQTGIRKGRVLFS